MFTCRIFRYRTLQHPAWPVSSLENIRNPAAVYRLFENTHLFTTVTPLIAPVFLNVIISLQKKPEAVLALSIIYWIICIGSYLLFLRAVRSLAQQHREYLQKKMEIKLMKKQINDSVQLSNEYASLRKWNHDIENHIMSVMYLMDMKKYEEAETYIASVLSRLNCRPQEKTTRGGLQS